MAAPTPGITMSRNGRYHGKVVSPEAASMVDLYLEDLSRYALLTPEEEDAIARRARAGDKQALSQLVRANLRFVVSVAKRYQNRGLPFADLVQEGNVGMVTAAKKFDPDQGVKFISYAVWWIRQAILASLARQSRSVRLPLNRATELARVLRVSEDLKQKLDRDPTPAEIAGPAELQESTVVMLLALNVAEVRLDAPVGDSEDSQLIDRFLVDESDVEEAVDATILKEHVTLALQNIRPRDARVLRLYYGLQGESEHTLEQIGQLLGVTRERVRQLRDRALQDIRNSEFGKALGTFAAA
ncbi:MAG: RNA polymerase sigma factor RpoD/SigA, partial [Gemmatimonadetes bacterium]|nr:RNA polymerase sigma factor RpoD/SigA [Gemmatimonadota bacterium]